MGKQPYIIFNGRNSNEFGLFLDYSNFEWQSTQRTRQIQQIPGLSGDRIYSDNRFDNVEQQFNFYLKRDRNKSILEIQSEISDWLYTESDYASLYFSGFPEYEFQAIASQSTTLKWQQSLYGEITITFNMKPFAYRIGADVYQPIDVDGTVLINPENQISLPKIKVYGSGQIGITINDQLFEVTDASNGVIIDSELMITHSDDGVLDSTLVRFPYHRYPVFEVGENYIAADGATRLEVMTKWHRLI